jgi:hypothetical protein
MGAFIFCFAPVSIAADDFPLPTWVLGWTDSYVREINREMRNFFSLLAPFSPSLCCVAFHGFRGCHKQILLPMINDQLVW